MHTIGQVLDLDGMRVEIDDLGEQVAAPDLWDDQELAKKVNTEYSNVKGDIDAVFPAAKRWTPAGGETK